MSRILLVALLGTAALSAGAAHAQPDSSRPMPSYTETQEPYPSGQGGYSDSYSSTDARPNYPAPPPPGYNQQGYNQQGDNQQGYGNGYADVPPPPPYEDEAHRQDRQRTAQLNSGDPQAQYHQQMAQHRQDMQQYRDAQARYAERIAHWRARADACEAGNINACEGPE